MENDRDFQFLLDKIKRNRNLDFREYRTSVLTRRIQYRMLLAGCGSYWDYVLLLNRDPEEYDRLIETLTIKVSDFFRDPSVFNIIGSKIIPEIVDRKQNRGLKSIYAWSCGSAFGQEAYSMAILFCEALSRKLECFDINILATDIDKSSLEKAKWAAYSAEAVKKVRPHILFKYFTRFQDNYIVNDIVRSLVSFRHHDLILDRQELRMDLVLCRNLLIYFEKALQEKAIRNLYSAMNAGGFLVLGKTETMPSIITDLFHVVDLKERVYMKR
jgi:chemotaxis methyl-accepting protein methylase